jgi:hypothetical protein
MNAHDPYLPLAAGGYFVTTGKTTWTPTDAEALADLLQGQNPPEFRTILAVQGAPDFGRLTADQVKALAYAGPFYADLDGEIGEVIPAFKALLTKLQALGLDLEAVRLFATGGRGFHLEIPPECFLPSGLPAGGIVGLPHVFREMAHQLYVNCLDMRVYSAKKGRMWRVPNRQRDNGKYKVPVTLGEALSMTVETYAELCAAPRAFPALAAPKFCADMGLMFAKAKGKVEAGKAKRKASASATEKELRSRFGAKLPGSILALGAGEFPVRDGVGWNQVAMQLALLAIGLGIDKGTLVAACKGLIAGHHSDGRYSSASRRESQLREQYDYLDGNPCYDVSVGGIRSILPQGLKTYDFRGML